VSPGARGRVLPAPLRHVTGYDDEGALLVTLRRFLHHGSLYDHTHGGYGPFYYSVTGGIFRLTGQDPTPFTGRLVVLVFTILSVMLFAGLGVEGHAQHHGQRVVRVRDLSRADTGCRPPAPAPRLTERAAPGSDVLLARELGDGAAHALPRVRRHCDRRLVDVEDQRRAVSQSRRSWSRS